MIGKNASYLASLEPRQVYERLKIVWALYKDDRVSRWHKLILMTGVAYAVFPLDLIPDFIPGLGLLDDIVVLILVGDWFIKACPDDIVEEHRQTVATGESEFDEDFKTLVYMVRQEFKSLLARFRS